MRNKNFLLLITTVSLMLAIFSVERISAQEDYKLREVRASPQIKQRLANLRNRIQAHKLTFQVGYTYARERGIENVTGGLKPNVAAADARKQNALAAQLVKIDNDARLAARVAQPKAVCSVNLKSWDWRREGKVTPVRKQKCGNCFAYAPVSALESSYLIRNNLIIDGSEQYIVSNADAGVCQPAPGGGGSQKVFEFLVSKGTAMDSILPDSGTNGTPDPTVATPYEAVTWGYANADNPWNPGVASIKEALCEHGPVSTWIDAGGTFVDYIGANEYGDVYNDDDDKEPGHKIEGHYVTIIGWNETKGAWLIKNSWGQDWGFNAGYGTDRGFGWVNYNTHQVGLGATWVEAKGIGYQLPRRYYELMPLKRMPVVRNPVVNSNTPVIKPSAIKRP